MKKDPRCQTEVPLQYKNFLNRMGRDSLPIKTMRQYRMHTSIECIDQSNA